MLTRSRRQRREQMWRSGLLLRHDDQAAELHRGVGQGFGSGGDDTVPKGDNPGQRVLTLPVAPDPLDRGAAARSGFVQELEGEKAFDKAPFEGDEVFGEGGLAESDPQRPAAGHGSGHPPSA